MSGCKHSVEAAHGAQSNMIPLSEEPGPLGTASNTQPISSTSQPANRWYLEAGYVNTPHAIITLDEHSHIFDMNPAALTSFSWAHDDPLANHSPHLLQFKTL